VEKHARKVTNVWKFQLKFKWAVNQEAVTFLGYRPIRP